MMSTFVCALLSSCGQAPFTVDDAVAHARDLWAVATSSASPVPKVLSHELDGDRLWMNLELMSRGEKRVYQLCFAPSKRMLTMWRQVGGSEPHAPDPQQILEPELERRAIAIAQSLTTLGTVRRRQVQDTTSSFLFAFDNVIEGVAIGQPVQFLILDRSTGEIELIRMGRFPWVLGAGSGAPLVSTEQLRQTAWTAYASSRPLDVGEVTEFGLRWIGPEFGCPQPHGQSAESGHVCEINMGYGAEKAQRRAVLCFMMRVGWQDIAVDARTNRVMFVFGFDMGNSRSTPAKGTTLDTHFRPLRSSQFCSVTAVESPKSFAGTKTLLLSDRGRAWAGEYDKKANLLRLRPAGTWTYLKPDAALTKQLRSQK